jgi:hypothetical protein
VAFFNFRNKKTSPLDDAALVCTYVMGACGRKGCFVGRIVLVDAGDRWEKQRFGGVLVTKSLFLCIFTLFNEHPQFKGYSVTET